MTPTEGVEKKFKSNKRILLITSSVILVVAVVAVFMLVYSGIGKKTFQNVSFLQQAPDVTFKTEYQNPFDKKTQYVNPFEAYKNPFVVAL